MAPAVIRSATTAHATRSPRYLGNTTPVDTAPTWWPARPTRCRPEATLGGASTWMTRSTAPMSMPSSRLDVATTQGSTPPFSSSSTSVRCSRDIDPWCAFATVAAAPPPMPDCPIASAGNSSSSCAPSASSAASSLSRDVSRSASRRELANTIVDRCARTSSRSLRSTAGQIDGRWAVPAAEPTTSSSELPGAGRSSSAARSGTGTSTDTCTVFGVRGWTTSTGRAPARNVDTSSSGRTVADRPMRCAGRSNSSSSRSNERARWAPRFVPATACTSSRITVVTPRSDSRAAEVSSRNSDSGVVTSTSGGVRANWRRSSAGVSPVRMPTVTSGTGSPSRCAACRMPASGERRLRWTSTASALSGET